MTIGPYSVGEFPTQPVVITAILSGYDDLNDYDTVEVVGPDLPEGTTTVMDATHVSYQFAEPFEASGGYMLRVQATSGERVDYSSWASFVVYDATLLTTAEAAMLTGENAPSIDRLLRAQAAVALVLDRDLADEDWLASLSRADYRRLVAAIAFTSVSTSFAPNAGTGQEIQSVKSGDETVTYRASGGTSVSTLPPLAMLMVDKLSWRSLKTNTLRAKLPDEYTTRNYDPYLSEVVRPPLAEDFYWHDITDTHW